MYNRDSFCFFLFFLFFFLTPKNNFSNVLPRFPEGANRKPIGDGPMARSGFVVSLLSQVYNGRNLNSLLFLLRARMFLLPCVLLTATLALAQYDVGGNGVQPTEATNGEVSLDTLNIHLDIPVVSKSGVGLPFSFGLHFNNNIWLLSSGAWSYNTHSNFWVGDGWYPTNTYGIEGFFVSGPLITCNGIQWSNYAGYQDSSGNIHSFSPVIIASQNGQYGCPTFTTYSTFVLLAGRGPTSVVVSQLPLLVYV